MFFAIKSFICQEKRNVWNKENIENFVQLKDRELFDKSRENEKLK